MEKEYITDNIINIGVYDKDMNLFENQYVLDNGIMYNSYLIKDENTIIIDTVDKRKTNEWLENLEKELNGIEPNYLLISHLEPDHSGSIKAVLEKYPTLKIVSNEKVFTMLQQFMDLEFEDKKVVVKEGDNLKLGKHILQFIMAPMVHWPEVMMTYEHTEKILFSADAFGNFGNNQLKEDWKEEARRYYINIVGKYGMQVQNVLKKVVTLDIKTICSLHGPVLKENLEYYINLYDIWSKYEWEEDGTLIVCGSLHGNTLDAAEKLAKELESKGEKVVLRDIARIPIPNVIAEAFKYSKMVVACATYNMSIFPRIREFLNLLKEKNYQNRKMGIIENGSWAPNAAKCIKEIIQPMKDITLIEPVVTIKTKLNEESLLELKKLSNELKI